MAWLTEYEPFVTFLSAVASIASAVAVIVYAFLTGRLIGITQDQAYDSEEQLAELKRRTDLEYRPKLIFKTVSGEVKETYPATMTLHNFNRYPILIEFFKFHFHNPENQKGAEMWSWSFLRHVRGPVEPFASVEVPLPSSVDGEEPTALMSFYYGGTGSQRYEYRASVSLIDGRVTSEDLKAVEGDNRFGFI